MIPVSANFKNLWKSKYAAIQLRVLHLRELWQYLTGRATATSSSNTVGNPPENTIDGNLGTYLEVANVSSVANGRYEPPGLPEAVIFTTWGATDYYLLPAPGGTSGFNTAPTWADDCATDQISTYIKTDASPYGIITWDATGYYVCQPSEAGGSGYAHLKKIVNNPVSQNPRTLFFENEWELRNGTTATMRFTSGWSITSVRDTAYGDIYISMHGGGNIELFHRPNRSTSLSSILLGTHSLAVGHKVKTRMLAKNGRYKIWLWVDVGAGWVVKVDGYEIVLYDFPNLYPEVGAFSPASATPPQRWLDYFDTGYLNMLTEAAGSKLEAIVGLTNTPADNRFMGWALRYDELDTWDMRNGVTAKFKIFSPAAARTNFVVRLVDNPTAPITQTGIEIEFKNGTITGSALEFYSQIAGHEIEISGRLTADRSTFIGQVTNTNLDTSVTLTTPITLLAANVWASSPHIPAGGVGFGSAFYSSQNYLDFDFYKISLGYFEISTLQEWLKIDLFAPEYIQRVRIRFDGALATPATLYAVFNGDFENTMQILSPATTQIITVGRIITEMLFYWTTSTDPVRILEVETESSEEINARDFRIARRKDYRLDQTLIGEANITASEEYDRFEPGDKIVVQAGYNYEFITIFTGYIDTVHDAIAWSNVALKMRDAMKPLARKKIAPNELVNQKVKDILDVICDEVGIDVSVRDFDDPSIFLDYWAPKDVRAIDEAKKLIAAAVDSEFYADEDGKIVFRSFLPSTKISELWDTDTDFDTKKSAISNFVIGANKITTSPTPQSIIVTSINNYGEYDFGSNYFLFGSEYGTLTQAFSNLIIITNIPVYLSGFKVKFKSLPFKEYTQEALQGILTPKMKIKIRADYSTGFQEWYFEVAPQFISGGSVSPADIPFFEQTLFFSPQLPDIDELVITSFMTWEFVTPPAAPWDYVTDYVYNSFQNISSVTNGYVHTIEIHALDNDYNRSIVEAIYTTTGTYCNWESINIPAAPTTLDLYEVIDDGYPLFNYYIRHSADGISFSPKIFVAKNTIPAVPIAAFYRVGVDAYAVTERWIDLMRFSWWVGGGGDRFARPIVLELTGDEIKDARRLKMDEVGGGNALINVAEVKAQPKYVAGADDDVWQGTVNAEPISASNPLVVSAAPLEFLIDLKEPIKESTQALQITWGAGGVSVTFTAHATKPRLVINSTGTITDMRITGRRIITDASIFIEESDPASIAIYGEAKETIDNDYINKTEIAAAKAELLVGRFAVPLQIIDIPAKFTPHLQLGDIIRVIYSPRQISTRAYVLDIQHTMSPARNNFTLDTKLKVLALSD